MTKRKMLTEAEQQRIGELREAGWTLRMIADVMKCSQGSVGWCCTKLGITRNPKALGGMRGPRVYMRGGRPVTRYSEEEDARILELRNSGMRIADLARALGRRQNSVTGRLYTLARHQAAAE